MLKKIKYILAGLAIAFPFCQQSFASNRNQVQIIPTYTYVKINQQIRKLYADTPASQSHSIIERLQADSAYFLGRPYLLGALGEGPAGEFDKSPLYRTDAFDCMTFTSTVLALAESKNFREFRDNILAIRYSKHPSFLTRNHFASVDWNINNQNKGYIENISKKLFPKEYKTAVAVINKPQWFSQLPVSTLKMFHPLPKARVQQLMQDLHGLSKDTQSTVSRLNYVPLTALYDKQGKPIADAFERIPSGVIIQIVRPNWNLKELIGTNLNISHLGFSFRINGKLYFREASSIKHKVVDIPLEKYLAGYLSSNTVKGINIELVKDK